MTPFNPGELTIEQARQLNESMRTRGQFDRLTVAPPLNLTRPGGIPAIRLDESALNIPTTITDDTFLALITAKCYYDGSDTRDTDGFTPTGPGLNCAPDLDCLSRFIQYSWMKVVESEPIDDNGLPCPLSYAEVDPPIEGGPQCFPLFHLGNVDLPVYPAASPRSHWTGIAADDASAGDVAWVSPENAEGVANLSYAACTLTAGQTTHYLAASGFCFNLAGNAVITNIEIQVTAHADGGSVTDVAAYLVLNGTTMSANKTAGAALTTSDAVQSFSFDLSAGGWNWTTLTPLNLNKSGWGFFIRYSNGSGTTRTVFVDSVKAIVSYTPTGVVIPGHSVVRIWRGAGDWYLFDQLSWIDLCHRTADSDADGVKAFLHAYDQNIPTFRDYEEVRVILPT